MLRLTKKTDSEERTTIGMPKAVACYWKLKKIEDIEEELGISLVTLVKALKNGIFYKRDEEIKHFVPNDDYHIVCDCNGSFNKINYWLLSIIKLDTNEYIDDFWISDYGKTWALTKEELEK